MYVGMEASGTWESSGTPESNTSKGSTRLCESAEDSILVDGPLGCVYWNSRKTQP